MTCGDISFTNEYKSLSANVVFNQTLTSECEDMIKQWLEAVPQKIIQLKGIYNHSRMSIYSNTQKRSQE